MKNVTLSADESLIEAARKRASSEDTTLNEQFRQWLQQLRPIAMGRPKRQCK